MKLYERVQHKTRQQPQKFYFKPTKQFDSKLVIINFNQHRTFHYIIKTSNKTKPRHLIKFKKHQQSIFRQNFLADGQLFQLKRHRLSPKGQKFGFLHHLLVDTHRFRTHNHVTLKNVICKIDETLTRLETNFASIFASSRAFLIKFTIHFSAASGLMLSFSATFLDDVSKSTHNDKQLYRENYSILIHWCIRQYISKTNNRAESMKSSMSDVRKKSFTIT